MRNNEIAVAWLKRTISNLEKAKVGKVFNAIMINFA